MESELPPLPISTARMTASTFENGQPTRPLPNVSENGSGHTTPRHSRHSREIEHEIRHLRDLLLLERQRADEAEARTREALNHLKTINDARVNALQDAGKANEELNLYKIQLETAQKEIYRAQDVLGLVDKQRLAAEREAADLRSRHRKLVEESKLQRAREQGRLQGIKEGLEKGRDLGLLEGRLHGYGHHAESGDGHAFENDGLRSPSSSRSSSLTDHHLSNSQPIQSRSRPYSRTHSVASSRHSVDRRSEHEIAIPIPPPVSRHASEHIPQAAAESIRPVSARNRSPSPSVPPAFFPPDNYIPHADADNIIRLPPPHEFHRPPQTPERSTTPQLEPDNGGRHQGSGTHTRIGTPYRRARRHSSPESNSTTISQMDLVNDPHTEGHGLRTPMSAIPEVTSVHTSPAPQSMRDEQSLRRQPSFAGSTRTQRSQRSDAAAAVQQSVAEDLRTPIYTRPRTTSGSTISMIPPPQAAHHQVSRPSQSTLTTAPPISVQPPSSPSSHETRIMADSQRETPATSSQPMPLPAEPPSFSNSSPEDSEFPTPIVLDTNELPPNFVAMSYTPGPTSAILEPVNSGEGPPVIPDSALFITDSEDSEGASSLDTLTTPPLLRRQLGHHQRTASAVGSQRNAAQVPLPPSTLAGTPRSTRRGASTTDGPAQVPLPPSTVAGTPKSTWGGTSTLGGAANMPLPPSTIAGTPYLESSVAGAENGPLPPSTTANTPRWGGSTVSKTSGSRSRPLSRTTNRTVG
ncbi:hypothetical protein AX17_005713 [Amanita inopinata Kibby_2008]|nr:hypothetical protein AX17_005713 [Amanita inopinata Kibby_2008]